MNRPETPTHQISNDEVVERARRALVKAGAKAMADYKRFGIEPVIANPSNGEISATSAKKK
jgi:hypothetical protein